MIYHVQSCSANALRRGIRPHPEVANLKAKRPIQPISKQLDLKKAINRKLEEGFVYELVIYEEFIYVILSC